MPEVSSDRLDRQIVDLVLAGAGNKQIARELGLPEGTVKWRVHRLYVRVGVSSRTQFVLKMQRPGRDA